MIVNNSSINQPAARPQLSKRFKVALALVVFSLISTVITGVTYATFNTSTSTGTSAFSSGTLALGNDHSATAVLTVSNNLIPGDTVSGELNVTNTGSEDVVGYQLVVANVGAGTNLTDSTKANSLKLWIQRCSVAWGGTAVSPTCAGTRSDVVGTSAAPINVLGTYSLTVGGANAFCSNSATQTAAIRTARSVNCDSTVDQAAGADHLAVRASFPSGADAPTFAGLAANIGFTFSGTQGTGANF